jgi:hypothetical protein
MYDRAPRMRLAAIFAVGGHLLAGDTYGQQLAAADRPVEAAVTAPKNCTIRCTLTGERYSFYTSERCLNSLNAKVLEEFNHKCIVKLERERRRQRRND